MRASRPSLARSASCALALALALAASSTAANSQMLATGRVFHDANKNGVFDLDESGIAGRPVSNGIEIHLTDRQGRWSLPARDDAIFFVVTGDGWGAPLGPHNLPQFYYIHKPHGSLDTRYPAIKPTGAVPDSIDFALYPTDDDDRFSILIFGDPQPANQKEVEYLARDVIGEASATEGHAFGISLGDVVSNDLSLFDSVNDAISLIGIPWHSVAGNHDINFDVNRDEDSDQTFESVYGPPNYAFKRGKVHFLMLDDVVYGGEEFAAKVRSGEIVDQRAYVGGFREDQFAFIESYLKLVAEDELIVLSMHIPLFQRQTSYYEKVESFRAEDRQRLFSLLERFPHTLSLSAHTHFQKQYFFSEEDGWRGASPHHHFNVGTTCGDWFCGLPTFDGYPDATMRDGTPNGYVILSFGGNQYRSRYKVAGAGPEKQMSLFVPFVVAKDQLQETDLYANVYMGTQYTRVHCRYDDEAQWTRMEQVYELDPRAVAMRQYQDELYQKSPDESDPEYKLISEPHPCAHLWKAPLSADLTPGYHLAEVKAIDRFGETFTDRITFRVE